MKCFGLLRYLKHTYPLIFYTNPHIKLFIVLVNPVNRAFYNWNMAKTIWNFQKTFEEIVEDYFNNTFPNNINFYTSSIHFIQKGFYYKQIVELFKWFPRYNVLILLEEEILKDKDKEFKKISNFLNVDYSKFTEIIINDKNSFKR